MVIEGKSFDELPLPYKATVSDFTELRPAEVTAVGGALATDGATVEGIATSLF